MPALLEYVRDEALPDREEILARLASHDRDVVLRMLTLMCPCRNACYDVAVWSTSIELWSSQWDREIKEAAHHALLTVRDRARVDTRSRELLDELASTSSLGPHAYPHWIRPQIESGATWATAVYPKLALHEVPTLIELLASDDERSVSDAIVALCPKDGRLPSKKVWRAILDAERSPDEATRRKAIAASAALDAHQMSCPVRHE